MNVGKHKLGGRGRVFVSARLVRLSLEPVFRPSFSGDNMLPFLLRSQNLFRAGNIREREGEGKIVDRPDHKSG
jgi:hypothetical protein